MNYITLTKNSANKKAHWYEKQTNQNLHENTQQNIPEEQKGALNNPHSCQGKNVGDIKSRN